MLGSREHTSVRHAHDNGVDAQVRAAVNQRLHARDERLAPLRRWIRHLKCFIG